VRRIKRAPGENLKNIRAGEICRAAICIAIAISVFDCELLLYHYEHTQSK
jgi:hypothetical protein